MYGKKTTLFWKIQIQTLFIDFFQMQFQKSLNINLLIKIACREWLKNKWINLNELL